MRIVGMGDTSGEKDFFVNVSGATPLFLQTESNFRVARHPEVASFHVSDRATIRPSGLVKAALFGGYSIPLRVRHGLWTTSAEWALDTAKWQLRSAYADRSRIGTNRAKLPRDAVWTRLTTIIK